MSLRARLVLSLGAILAVALVVAGVALVGLTRASQLDAVDRELQTVAARPMAMATMMNAASVTDDAGRRLAVLRLSANGRVVSATPSGYADSPDPLPLLPEWTGGVPAGALGTIVEMPSADGTVRLCARAEADQADARRQRPGHRVEEAERVSGGAGAVVKRQRLARARRIEMLAAVQRGAVNELAESSVHVLGHTEHAEEIALREQHAPVRPDVEKTRRHDRRQTQAEPDRP